MRSSAAICLSLWLAMLLGCAPAAAQEMPTLHLGTQLVLVDASVVDCAAV